MKINSPRVRFAPSPTGLLHVGNARTALLNWLFARRYQGTFILRIEDTDQERSSDRHTESLMEELAWLGLSWDEGPVVGGEAGPYYQSERIPIYASFLQELKNKNLVYPCFCSETELELERQSLLSRRLPPRYSGKCRHLSRAELMRHEAAGRPCAYRFAVTEGEVFFEDLIRGKMKFDGRFLGDFIIIRSSGIPAYNFAVVVDDYLMKVTQVIRGEDHLSNTAYQLMLYRALSFTPPAFAHHSLVLGADHTKLSKRHGAVSVGEYRRQGLLPEALVNYLAVIGSSFTGEEIQPLETLAANFSLERLGHAGAVFDRAKLDWLNHTHIGRMNQDRLVEKIEEFISRHGGGRERPARDFLGDLVGLCRNNLTSLADIFIYLDMFLLPHPPFEPEAENLLREASSREVLESALRTKEITGADNGFSYRATMEQVMRETGLKGRKLYLPLRAALTGRLAGPELEGIFTLLGAARARQRLENALLTAG